MLIKELFVKTVPLLDTNDVVHNHVGLVLRSVIQRLNLGEFVYMNKIIIQVERRELFKIWKSRILGC
jgi:hypothetical protein